MIIDSKIINSSKIFTNRCMHVSLYKKPMLAFIKPAVMFINKLISLQKNDLAAQT